MRKSGGDKSWVLNIKSVGAKEVGKGEGGRVGEKTDGLKGGKKKTKTPAG